MLCADALWGPNGKLGAVDPLLGAAGRTDLRVERLDLENGLLIQDPEALLKAQNQAELQRLLALTTRIYHHSDLETVEDYPLPVRRLLKRLNRTRMDRLVNQVL